MGTFKTFAIYAGAVICFGGLIFAGIRMMSGRFQDAIPGLFGALFGAGVLDGARAGSDLVRSEIHPMEEAQGFRALLDLEDPKYSIEQIAAKVGKSPVFVASRLKLSDLVPAAVEAFYADEIGVGHALRLAKLPADQQEPALHACFKEVYNGGSKPARILLPVRNLQFWIDGNILLVLKDAAVQQEGRTACPDRWQLCRLPQADRP